MKKILVAAFAVAFAACVHAAAFQWSFTGTIYEKGSDTVALSGFTAYLFDSSAMGQAALLEGIRGGASITDYTSLSSFTGSTKVNTTGFCPAL